MLLACFFCGHRLRIRVAKGGLGAAVRRGMRREGSGFLLRCTEIRWF